MGQRTTEILFALLRSATCKTRLTEQERKDCTAPLIQDALKIATEHDVAHLFVQGLKENDLLTEENKNLELYILKAVTRYEQTEYEYQNLCNALEGACIPFIPLKGSVLRKYYPQPWMRTSCDIDILVKRENLDDAISCLNNNLQYVEKSRFTHDVSLFAPSGIHVELHFDLIEEGRAKQSANVLSTVWEDAKSRDNFKCWLENSDALFYFYHLAHMAKHFETGGCGIRPFIDLWILDNLSGVDLSLRDALLEKGGLIKFANSARRLSEVWLGDATMDNLSYQMQQFILGGGIYGSSSNRVALQQANKGGKAGYMLSRIFVPYSKLKRLYPILEKHRWLTPFMQVKRWFMLFRPDVAKMAKTEFQANKKLKKSTARKMNKFLQDVGLD